MNKQITPLFMVNMYDRVQIVGGLHDGKYLMVSGILGTEKNPFWHLSSAFHGDVYIYSEFQPVIISS